MAYYGYHQRIRQRINAGELIGYDFVTNYPGIGEALVLRFSTMPHLRPIRPYRWPEYRDVFGGELCVC